MSKNAAAVALLALIAAGVLGLVGLQLWNSPERVRARAIACWTNYNELNRIAWKKRREWIETMYWKDIPDTTEFEKKINKLYDKCNRIPLGK